MHRYFLKDKMIFNQNLVFKIQPLLKENNRVIFKNKNKLLNSSVISQKTKITLDYFYFLKISNKYYIS